MKRKLSMMAMAILMATAATAQNDWTKNIKLGGYVIGEYQYSSQDGKTPKDNFSTRFCYEISIKYN